MFKRPTEAEKSASRQQSLQTMRQNLKQRRRDELLRQMLEQQRQIVRLQTQTTRRPFAAGSYTNGEMTIIGLDTNSPDYSHPRPGTIEAAKGERFFPNRKTPRGEDTLGSRLMDAIEDKIAANNAAMLDRLGIGA